MEWICQPNSAARRSRIGSDGFVIANLFRVVAMNYYCCWCCYYYYSIADFALGCSAAVKLYRRPTAWNSQLAFGKRKEWGTASRRGQRTPVSILAMCSASREDVEVPWEKASRGGRGIEWCHGQRDREGDGTPEIQRLTLDGEARPDGKGLSVRVLSQHPPASASSQQLGGGGEGASYELRALSCSHHHPWLGARC